MSSTQPQMFGDTLRHVHQILGDAVEAIEEYPLDVGRACGVFGLGPPIVEEGARSQHGALRQIAQMRHPVVYRQGPGSDHLTARERFTVAHEIGHGVIEHALGVRPARRSEYWAMEQECDHFAGRMLVPDTAVNLFNPRCRDAIATLETIRDLSRATVSTLPCAAKRLIGALPGVAAFGVVERLVAGEMRSYVSWTSDPDGRYSLRQHARVGDNHAMSTLVEAAPSRIGSFWERRLSDGTTAAAVRVATRKWLAVVWRDARPVVASDQAQQLPLNFP